MFSQRNLLCALSHDRSVLLVDVRERLPLRRLVLRMRSNAVAWSPTRAFNLTLANEDYKCAHLLCALCIDLWSHLFALGCALHSLQPVYVRHAAARECSASAHGSRCCRCALGSVLRQTQYCYNISRSLLVVMYISSMIHS